MPGTNTPSPARVPRVATDCPRYVLLLGCLLGAAPLRLQLGPDFQYVQNPGFKHDRGPVRFYAVRLHLEY